MFINSEIDACLLSYTKGENKEGFAHLTWLDFVVLPHWLDKI